jgi:hypothetical protein
MARYGMLSDRVPADTKCVIGCSSLGHSVVGLLEIESEATISNAYTPAFGNGTAQDTVKGLMGTAQYLFEGDSSVDTERTLTSDLNTRQIYDGSEPPSIELELFFVAFENPAIEVEGAIQALKQMALPALKTLPTDSRPPPEVTVNLRRQILLTKGRIESFSVHDYGAYSKKGTLWTKCSVSIKGMQMPDKLDDPEVYGSMP